MENIPIYRTIQFQVLCLTATKLLRIQAAEKRSLEACDALIVLAREHYDELSFTYDVKDKDGRPVLNKKTGEVLKRQKDANFLAGDLRKLLPPGTIALASDIKTEVYTHVAKAILSSFRLKQLKQSGKLNLSGGVVGLLQPYDLDGRKEQYHAALQLLCDLPFLFDDTRFYASLLAYLDLQNEIAEGILDKADFLLTNLPYGPAVKKEDIRERDRLRKGEIAERLESVVDLECFEHLSSKLKKTVRYSIAWHILAEIQRLEATGMVTFEGEERRTIFREEGTWKSIVSPLKVKLSDVDQAFSTLIPDLIATWQDHGGILNESFVSHCRVLSGPALLAIEGVVRDEITRLLDPDLPPLRSTNFKLYMHRGLNPNRVQARGRRKERGKNRDTMVVEKMNKSLFIYFPLFSRGDSMCVPNTSKEDFLVPLFGAGKVPKHGQGLLLPLRGGAFQEAWVKERIEDMRGKKRLVDRGTGAIKAKYEKLRVRVIMPKVAEFIKKGHDYFLNLSFSIEAPKEVIPQHVLGISFGLDDVATCTVVDLPSGKITEEFQHYGIGHIAGAVELVPKYAALQQRGVDIRGRGYKKVLDEFTYGVVNQIVLRALEFHAVIVVEDLTPGPLKTGPNRDLNRKHSLWNYGKLTQYLLDKAREQGLPFWVFQKRPKLFSVLSFRAHFTCSGCGETNVGKKKGEEERLIEITRDKEKKKDSMHCKKCGLVVCDAVNASRVIAARGREKYLEAIEVQKKKGKGGGTSTDSVEA